MSNIIYIILTVVCVLIVFVTCLKYPKIGKWLLLGVLGIGLLALTINSCVNLIEYNTAQSTTHGSYEDMINGDDTVLLNTGNFVVEVDI